MDEEKYAKAYNTGYFMAKLEPEMFKMLEPSLSKDDPMLHGKQEFEIEKVQGILRSSIKVMIKARTNRKLNYFTLLL